MSFLLECLSFFPSLLEEQARAINDACLSSISFAPVVLRGKHEIIGTLANVTARGVEDARVWADYATRKLRKLELGTRKTCIIGGLKSYQ